MCFKYERLIESIKIKNDKNISLYNWFGLRRFTTFYKVKKNFVLLALIPTIIELNILKKIDKNGEYNKKDLYSL